VAGPLADGLSRCEIHDVTYGKLEQCATCRAQRAGTAAATSPKADTSPLRVKAADYRLRELVCWQGFEAQIADDPHVAVKLSDQAGKWAGRADELESRLLEFEHDQWLIEQDRERRGGGN
jgi:hypothetical protein